MEIIARKIISIILCAILLFCISACKDKKQRFDKVFIDYFDTVITVIGYESDKQNFEIICDKLEADLDRYHKLFDIYNTYDDVNNLCVINKNACKSHIKVDREIIDFLLFCKQMHTLTKGNTNVALGSVLSIWHNYRTNALNNPDDAKIPKRNDLIEASKHSNIEDVIINETESTVYIADEKLTIDAGAVAKGYVLEILSSKYSLDGYAINMGGMVKGFGTRADGSDWSVGIENPNDVTKTEIAVTPKNLTVVTSGSYQRYYEVNGVRYHHIINPETLYPENEYLSVTVLSDNSALGDVLSTALFNMTIEEGKSVLDSIDDKTSIMWILKSGEKKYYGDFENYIKKA